MSNGSLQNNSYTVPTLSLSGSRSRKNIPTKDVYQSIIYNIQASNLSSNVYFDRKQELRTSTTTQNRTRPNNINFPPKGKNSNTQSIFPLQKGPIQITRNVYLNSDQQPHHSINQHTHQQTTATTTAIQRAREILSHQSTGVNLLRNPQSTLQIHQQVARQTHNMQYKKIDINKALYDRKLTKLFQEIDFYEEQLQCMHSDSLVSQIQELQDMKEENRQAHYKIISDLNALLA